MKYENFHEIVSYYDVDHTLYGIIIRRRAAQHVSAYQHVCLALEVP